MPDQVCGREALLAFEAVALQEALYRCEAEGDALGGERLAQPIDGQCRPRLQLGNKEGLKEENNHRNLIGHRGVDQIDGTLLRSIQTKAIDIIKRKT